MNVSNCCLFVLKKHAVVVCGELCGTVNFTAQTYPNTLSLHLAKSRLVLVTTHETSDSVVCVVALGSQPLPQLPAPVVADRVVTSSTAMNSMYINHRSGSFTSGCDMPTG